MGCLLNLITWPFRMSLTLIGWILSVVSRLVAFLIGMAVCAVGVLLCLTLIGAILGVPMILFGVALIFKSIF